MSLLRKLFAVGGMALGAGGILTSFFICRAWSNLPKFSTSDDHPPYVLIVVMAALGVALVVVAYDFGFRHTRMDVDGDAPNEFPTDA